MNPYGKRLRTLALLLLLFTVVPARSMWSGKYELRELKEVRE